jgi:hypothetical protein
LKSISLLILKDVIFDSLENIDAASAAVLSSSTASHGQMRSALSLLKVLHVFVRSHIDLSLLSEEVYHTLCRDGYVSPSEERSLSSSSSIRSGHRTPLPFRTGTLSVYVGLALLSCMYVCMIHVQKRTVVKY